MGIVLRQLAAGTMLASMFVPVALAHAQERAAERVSWQQSPIVFAPGELEAGSAPLAEDGPALVIMPLRWLQSTRLPQDVMLNYRGETVTLGAQTLLPKVRITGADNPAASEAFCTRSQVAENREGTGITGMLVGGLLNSVQDMQLCLRDSDGDGTLDRGMVLGDGDRIIDLGAIDPVPFAELTAEPMGTRDDRAIIYIVSVGRRRVQLGFGIIQRGRARGFTNFESGRYTARSFNDFRLDDSGAAAFELLGVAFTVVPADGTTDTARLQWQAAAAPDDFAYVADNVRTR